jgi:hypothetical protein
MKNRLFAVLALVGLVGFTACERQEDVRVEETTEYPVTTPATDPAWDATTTDPMTTDTLVIEDETTADTQVDL